MVRIGLPVTYRAEILLGRISKVYGHDGTVNIRLEKKFIEKIPLMESVFLEVEGKPVPFLIESSDYPGGDILRLKFDGYNSIEKVSEFTGCRVFLTENDGSIEQNHPDFHLLSGYSILLADGSLLGTINSIIENPGQMLAAVQVKGKKEIYIPLHEDLITSVDQKRRQIIMDLPEGLTELD